MTSRFIQIHTLTAYPAALLNRDDAGFAKRIPWGGAVRTRISSQCLKRHWRTFEGKGGLQEIGVPMSIRSRRTFEHYVVQPLIEEGKDPAIVRGVTEEMMALVLGESAKSKKKKRDEEEGEPELHTGQITILGHPEVSYLKDQVAAIIAEGPEPKKLKAAVKSHFGRDGKANLAGLRNASGLDAALFGRMVTSDILARGDAAIHVAHALTVHEEQSETDYFSAVDDLLAETGETGSGHINTAELTSGLYYGYVVVDVPLLVSNLEGCTRSSWEDADRTLAGEVVERLVKIIATVSPGAKLGSTAPHAWSSCVLVEAGNSQPRSLASAFLSPVQQQPDVLANAYEAMATHVSSFDGMYGSTWKRSLSAIQPSVSLAEIAAPCSLDESAQFARQQVVGE